VFCFIRWMPAPVSAVVPPLVKHETPSGSGAANARSPSPTSPASLRPPASRHHGGVCCATCSPRRRGRRLPNVPLVPHRSRAPPAIQSRLLP
jgi:hypothetical protein